MTCNIDRDTAEAPVGWSWRACAPVLQRLICPPNSASKIQMDTSCHVIFYKHYKFEIHRHLT
jgi:hypothetical protein